MQMKGRLEEQKDRTHTGNTELEKQWRISAKPKNQWFFEKNQEN